MFAAGYLPGILIAFADGSFPYYYAKKHNHPRRTHKIPMKEVVYTLKESIIGLMCPAILVTGIFSGYFTQTEAAVLLVFTQLLQGSSAQDNEPEGSLDSFVTQRLPLQQHCLLSHWQNLFRSGSCNRKNPQLDRKLYVESYFKQDCIPVDDSMYSCCSWV